MQFFPHRTPVTTIGLAVSASTAASASLISNFGSIPIATASIATNITGSTGTPGADYTKVGAVGLQGIQGDRGVRGDSLYILAVGWSSPAPSTCDPVTIGAFVPPDGCDTSNAQTYYVTSSNFVGGAKIYYNDTCTTLATSLSDLTYGTTTFNTNVSGEIVDLGTCNPI